MARSFVVFTCPLSFLGVRHSLLNLSPSRPPFPPDRVISSKVFTLTQAFPSPRFHFSFPIPWYVCEFLVFSFCSVILSCESPTAQEDEIVHFMEDAPDFSFFLGA